jgi:hypothetical protein
MQVVYEIHGDIADAGSRASVLCESPVTLRKVQALFPFEGTFHFRTKVSARKFGFADCDYLWMDLVEPDKPITSEDGLVEVQALAISIPEVGEGAEDSYDEYLEDISRYVPAERQPACEARPPKRNSWSLDEQDNSGASSPFGSQGGSSSGGGAFKPAATALKNLASTVKQSVNLDTVKSGATSIWNKVKATAAQLQQQVISGGEDTAASKAAADLLAMLAKDVNTPFSDNSAFHVQLLEHLWSLQFPDRPFARHSAVWKQAGWQKDDPIADLKNSGLLALHCMVYLGENYPERALQMLQAQMPNKKDNYPYAIVGVNVTLLLAELFRLRDSG